MGQYVPDWLFAVGLLLFSLSNGVQDPGGVVAHVRIHSRKPRTRRHRYIYLVTS